MDKVYSVEELAKIASVTPRTVRLYVERGLLIPLHAGRTLCFTPENAEALDAILRAKRLGFRLEEIKRHLNDKTTKMLNERLKRVRRVKADAEQELAVLTTQLKDRT
jgi:DNA-binding transcriptional MerR regulator